jgi:transcriptional regulator with GAF, ATPase, and Fis domain
VVKSLAAQARETTTSLDEIALAELNIIGRHPSFRAALSRASQFARSPFPVLIQGETGKGKERVARYIHRLSGLPTGSLEVVNCAALPRELAASLLFGHRKGAFERADGGVAGPGGLAAVRRRPHGKRRAPRAP